jgi:signal transduction histidine kinase
VDFFEWTHQRVDGTEFPAEVKLSRFDYRGESVLVALIRDITERTANEQKLRRQNERLKEFASVVAHDLRNPLNVAQARIELAAEDCESAHLDTAAKNIERSFDLIDDMLTLAREGEQVAEMEPLDLASFVESCWDNVETATATVVAETDGSIHADPSRLRQLLENLMGNAVEHGSDDVTVRVGALPDGFYVADDGPGIPEGDRETVFEPGYSTTDDGTGFGLAIVRRIAHAHDWSIAVTEGPDGGARFEFTNIAGAGE